MVTTSLLSIVFILAISVSSVYIENNGYKDVTIAFSPSIGEADVPFDKLKQVIRRSSEILFQATGRRSYLSNIILSLPSTWKDANENCVIVKKSPRDISVYITKPGKGESRKILAQHSKGCGENGEVIFLPENLLHEYNLEKLSREFVQQWAIYRYGVFEESASDEKSCFTKDGKHWIPSSCFNIDIEISNDNFTLDENGLPSCDPIDDWGSTENLRSSLMSTSRSKNVLEFCNGSNSLPHSPLTPTRHNALCGGQSVWKIIKNSADFKHGRNPPIRNNAFEPSVSFQCYTEIKDHIIFAIQTQTFEGIEEIVSEIRTSLLRFLTFDAPRETAVTLIPYHEETEDPYEVNLSTPASFQETVMNIIRSQKIVNNINVLGGLREALNVSRAHENLNNIIVFIVLASALRSQNLFDFLEEVQNSEEVIHLIVIQDILRDVLPSSLINAVHKSGGQIFMLPRMAVLLSSKLSMLLPITLRSPFHFHDKIIVAHQASYFNIKGNFSDVFTTEVGLKGKMIYTVMCNIKGRLYQEISTCMTSNLADNIFCVNTTALNTKTETKNWEFKFKDRGGIESFNCSTMATVRLDEDSSNPITVRGWLSDYNINPGENVLIIYAEVMQNNIPITDVQVNADVYSSSTEGPPISVELWDNGNGDSDVRKGDGIYSRYFTQIHDKGMHSVVIRTKRSPTVSTSNENSKIDLMEFARKTVIGSFMVSKNPPNSNSYPPSRVGDLKVVSVNHIVPTVTLQWTAPGNDYDHGTAMKYEMKFSSIWSELTEIAFDSIRASHFEEKIQVLQGGSIQIQTFQLPPKDTDFVYYVALKAFDKENNEGKVSNIAQIFIKAHTGAFTNDTSSTESIYVTNTTLTEADLNHTIFTKSVINVSTTLAPINNTEHDECDSCDHEEMLILVASISGGVLVFIFVVNILFWLICIRKNKKPKTKTRNASLRPPNNLTIAYNDEPNATNSSLPLDDYFNDDLDDGFKDFEIDNDYTFVTSDNQRKQPHTTDRFRNSESHNTDNRYEITTPANRNSTAANNGRSQHSNRDTQSEPQHLEIHGRVIPLGYI